MTCYICHINLDNADFTIPVRKMGAPENRIYLCSEECWGEYKAMS